MMLESNFWDDNRSATKKIASMNSLKEIIDDFNRLFFAAKNFIEELNQLRTDYDMELHELMEIDFLSLLEEIESFEMLILLNDEHDSKNAIIEIHPGAGGVESQDWAEMLYRMYVRYGEKKNFKFEVLDYQVGEEAGIKSVSMLIKGKNAYGFLKSEKGVHRLVRISPFDSSGRRHTSFASVEVMPELEDDLSIEIKEEDLRVDTFRSSGAGGQHVNKTESAVRITHLPTNFVTSCQTERSQIQNRERAMKLLKSKLFQKMIEEKQKEMNSIRGEQKSIEWGSQIRSYVFCPYCLVKDHRTNFEKSDVEGVMNGKIDDFIYSYLKMGVK